MEPKLEIIKLTNGSKKKNKNKFLQLYFKNSQIYFVLLFLVKNQIRKIITINIIIIRDLFSSALK